MANFGPYRWHVKSKYTYKEVSGSIDAWYNGTTVFASATVTQVSTYQAYNGGGFGPDTVHLFIGGVEVSSSPIGAYTGTYTINVSGNRQVNPGNVYVELKIQCGDYQSCPIGAHTNWVPIGGVNINVPNPYTPSSIWLNPNDYTRIGRVDVSNWSFHYSYNAGSNPSVPITLAIHDYNATSWGVKWEPLLRNASGYSDGVWDSVVLRSAQGIKNANRYRVTLVSKGGEALSPNSWNPQEGYVIYTYQEPTIGQTVNILLSRQNANTSNTFSINSYNNRQWTSYENDFETRYRIKKGNSEFTSWINIGNISTWNNTAAQIRQLVPKQYDDQNIILEMKRYSPSADWWSNNTATGNFKVIYRPQIGVLGKNVYIRRNSNAGSSISKGQVVINDSNLSGINVAWAYDDLSADAGFTQGYRIRLYNAKNQVVKTYYTRNQDYTIPKADIPRIQLTKLDITPYFANDSTDPNQYWYYNKGTIEIFDFIILSSPFGKPVIDYPVQNADWINHNFRICFTLPEDGDKGFEDENYHYENIEVQINGNITLTLANSTNSTPNAIIAPECFSALVTNLTYRRKIIINPSACNQFPINTNIYSIKIRVKKKYGYNNITPLWSPWSDIKNITVTQAQFNPKRGDIILASHYNNAKALIDRVRQCYNINWINIPVNVISKIDFINTDQYKYNNMLDKINDVKNIVNTYGPFDSSQENVKFDYQNLIPTNFTSTNEIITAESKEDNSPNGRNYIKIIYDRCNKLL
mgnify:FL=1